MVSRSMGHLVVYNEAFTNYANNSEGYSDAKNPVISGRYQQAIKSAAEKSDFFCINRSHQGSKTGHADNLQAHLAISGLHGLHWQNQSSATPARIEIAKY
jgi:hypothetical protein